MSNFDDYFTNDDKPFAENMNDALLLSNVFDFTVPIELPRMFSNSVWLNTVSPRKAGVSIVTLDELMSGISIDTDGEDNSILTATEDAAFGFYFYPNFNSFGQISSITWEGTEDITVDLYTNDNVLIAENISKGTIQESTVHLRFDEDSYRLTHYCANPECPSGDVLPVYMVDHEIYRYFPGDPLHPDGDLHRCNPRTVSFRSYGLRVRGDPRFGNQLRQRGRAAGR